MRYAFGMVHDARDEIVVRESRNWEGALTRGDLFKAYTLTGHLSQNWVRCGARLPVLTNAAENILDGCVQLRCCILD